ncbi:hypothetical protein [Frankia gtarii]|uniref:hypothetical protein n=1 Tax=Frankia gtarii TaxID=2950102 RepID=UPI0021C03495|nr:hypothetical protein [Frankia gtarii]
MPVREAVAAGAALDFFISENEYRCLLAQAGCELVDVMGTEALDGEIHPFGLTVDAQ